VRAPALLAAAWVLASAPGRASEGLKEVATLTGYTFPPQRAALSPDGKVLAAGGGDGRGGDLWLWDAATGKEIGRLGGDTHSLNGLAFSADGKRLASCGGALRVWDLQARQALDTFKPPSGRGALAVGLSPDGQRVAAAGGLAVNAWDLPSGRERISFRRLVRGSGWAADLAFSPDLRVLAAGNYQDIDLWDTATGKLRGVLGEHRGAVCCVTFGADGKLLAAAAVRSVGRNAGRTEWKGEVRLWETGTGRERAAFQDRFVVVRALALSPDGRTLALLDQPDLYEPYSYCDLKLLDLTTGRERVIGHDPAYPFVPSLCFAPGGKLLVVGAAKKAAKVWEVAAPPAPRAAP
jgi:WD40 repeat protein